MAKVRTHKVTRDGKTYTRTQHSRAGKSSKARALRPRRAWRNAKLARYEFRNGRQVAGMLWGTAALTEIVAFTVFKSAGGLLFVVGVMLALTGQVLATRAT